MISARPAVVGKQPVARPQATQAQAQEQEWVREQEQGLEQGQGQELGRVLSQVVEEA